MLTAETRLVALLGHPVRHSLSPRMQNAAFAARGLDWAYVALDVTTDDLPRAVAGLAAAGFAGANVTAPHKLAAAKLCDEANAESVNTLVFRDGKIVGTSTDAAVLETLPAASSAVIVGGGGAARAFAAALPEARTFTRRGEWPPDVGGADLIVHATPEREHALVTLHAGQTLIDLPYPESATARAARDAGAAVVDGFDVLVHQGARSFELWTGVPAPLEVMRRTVRNVGTPPQPA